MMQALPSTIFSVGIAFFCIWTLGTNLVALTALPLEALYVVLAAAVGAAAFASRGSTAIAGLFSPGRLGLLDVSLDIGALAQIDRRKLFATGILVVLFAAAAAVEYKKSVFLPLWLVCILTAGLALLWSGFARSLVRLHVHPRREDGIPVGVGMMLLIVALLGFYYMTSVPDPDDSLYLNLAVGAIRDRGAVFAHDTMLGLPGLVMIKSTFRLESYQLLTAIISDISGLPVTTVAYAVVPAFALIFAASILILVHRTLFAQDWPVTIAMHFAWLIALDGKLQSYGYHGICRFFQGKAPFVTAMLPLIAHLTIFSIRDRSWPALGLLAAAVVASIGFTANAIYAAPLTAALVATPMFLLGDQKRRITCLRLALTVVYPAAMVAYLLLLDPPRPSEAQSAGAIGGTLWALFGTPYALAGGLSLLFAAAAAAFLHRVLRGVSIYVLALLIVVVNPFVWDLYGRAVTGNVNYRLLWAVPLPLVLAAMTGVAWRSTPKGFRPVLIAVLIAAMAAPGSILNRVTWGFSLLKVPQPYFRVARKVDALALDNGLILAPEEIAAWIPTLDNAHPVVEARWVYLMQRAADVPPRQYRLRKFLFEWVSADLRDSSATVAAALKALNVQLVVIRDDARSAQVRQEIKTFAAYSMIDKFDHYLVYARHD
jgi:Family of unknown function (DUF6077)